MCGRFTVRNIQEIQSEHGVTVEASFNTAPSHTVLTVTDKAKMMKWSYNPTWAKKPMNIINARSETLNEKPSFKMAKRCTIVADGWFEWHRKGDKKQPYFFHLNNNIFLFAGIYNEYQGVNGCAIITKEANENLGKVHHRMPILLENNEARNWLQGEDVYASNLSEKIEYYPVSMFVNSPRNNTEDCVRNTGSTGEHY